jgi:hypothetical protein
MSGKLTNEDMLFLAKLPLSDKQLIELLKWAHTYKEEEKSKSEIESIFKCDMEKIKE